MTAKLSIVLNSVDNALAVPVDALQEDDDGNYYVEVVKRDVAGSDGWPDTGTDGEEHGGAAGSGTEKAPGQEGAGTGTEKVPGKEGAGTGTEGSGENAAEPDWQEPEGDGAPGGMGAWDGAGMQALRTEKITVQKGLESDYYVEIISKAIEAGMEVVVPAAENQDIQSMMLQMGPMGGF